MLGTCRFCNVVLKRPFSSAALNIPMPLFVKYICQEGTGSDLSLRGQTAPTFGAILPWTFKITLSIYLPHTEITQFLLREKASEEAKGKEAEFSVSD